MLPPDNTRWSKLVRSPWPGRALLAVLLAWAWPAMGNPPPGAGLEFVSASVTLGPGMAPREGSAPFKPELVGVLRVKGLDNKKSNFRITLLEPQPGSGRQASHRVSTNTWASCDPKEPALIRWTAPWTETVAPEGCTVRVEYHHSSIKRTVTGPILVFLLPATPPHQPRPGDPRD